MIKFRSKAGVYKITCLSNDLVYIGSTKNISKRRQDHFCRLRGNYHENDRIQNCFNKYGEFNFKFEVLEYMIGKYDVDYVLQREQYYLDFYKSYEANNGFNFAKIAYVCWDRIPVSKETKQKQREAKLKNPTRYWLGKKHSKETRKKISEVQIGRKESEKTKQKRKETYLKNVANGVKMFKSKPAIIVDPDGNEHYVDNVAEFARNNNLLPSSLQRVASGKRNNYKGYKAKYIK